MIWNRPYHDFIDGYLAWCGEGGDHPLLGLYLCIVLFSYHPPLLPYLYPVSLALVILVPLMMKYQLTSKILAKNTFLHTSTVTLHSVIISKYNYTDLYLR